MGIKAALSKPFAAYVNQRNQAWMQQPAQTQQKVFTSLIQKGAFTNFGLDHKFKDIRSHADFAQVVPVRDYEGLKPYFEKVKKGEPNILWPGKPIYFAKTSGTTSGTKYIPITADSISNHINGARDALLAYVHQTGKSAFLDGKLIFLSGSPELDEVSGIKTGRLSG
ncbi:MAG: GH3 auxin-responsive promoter family protein, partial [Bacteroidota bacterium]|nr:GH3 auxin-responsive promoter family protein [Bacteroidota bacterium]